MSRFLILLPAPEAEWAELPPSEHEKWWGAVSEQERGGAELHSSTVRRTVVHAEQTA